MFAAVFRGRAGRRRVGGAGMKGSGYAVVAQFDYILRRIVWGHVSCGGAFDLLREGFVCGCS